MLRRKSKVKSKTKGKPTVDEVSFVLRRRQGKKVRNRDLMQIRGTNTLAVDALIMGAIPQDKIPEITAVNITNPATKGGIPNSLDDPKMGHSEIDGTCATDGLGYGACPGHLGRIELARKFWSQLFIQGALDILNSICHDCGALLVDKEILRNKGVFEIQGVKRLRKIAEISKKVSICPAKAKGLKKCSQPYKLKLRKDGTSGIQNIVVDDKETLIIYPDEPLRDGEDELTPYQLFKQLTENAKEDKTVLSVFGFVFDPEGGDWLSKPEDFILRYLPVLPPKMRAHNIAKGKITDNPLTSAYVNIVKQNEILKKDPTNQKTYRELDDLIFRILTYRESAGNKFEASIPKTLRKKEGMIRNNMMGKRVNYATRSVITPDPNISVDEVGVPAKVAMVQTVPVNVNSVNIAYLQRLVDQKKVKNVIQNGVRYYPHGKGSIMLQIGDVVSRNLQNGDYILINRQPTLHKEGFMSLRARIIPGILTLRINPHITSSFNADFDGRDLISFD